MAASTFNSTLNIQYTPPSAPANSGVASLVVGGTYNGGQAGSIDVPTTIIVSPPTVIPVPFGSVAAAKLLIIRNNMSSEIGVRLNGAVANTFNLPPGGEFVYAVPTTPGAIPLTSADVIPTVVPTVTEQIHFFVFGD
jgi:hypothetical protein